MQEKLRKLNLIFRFTELKPEMFYTISFDSSINLQAHFHSDIIKIAQKLKFSISICEINGYVQCYRDGIIITLTE